MSYQQWRKQGKHLPKFLRDFHDQKAFFKTLDEFYPRMRTIGGGELDWMTAHAFTIDRLLWFLAQHGWTLQRSRTRLTFCDLERTLAEAARLRAERFWSEVTALETKPPKP